MKTSSINAIQTSDIGNNFTKEEVRKIVEALITNQPPVVTVPERNIVIMLKDVM